MAGRAGLNKLSLDGLKQNVPRSVQDFKSLAQALPNLRTIRVDQAYELGCLIPSVAFI